MFHQRPDLVEERISRFENKINELSYSVGNKEKRKKEWPQHSSKRNC
jgi:hypothetical protein